MGSRETFEKWLLDRNQTTRFWLDKYWDPDTEEYNHSHFQGEWGAWQAACQYKDEQIGVLESKVTARETAISHMENRIAELEAQRVPEGLLGLLYAVGHHGVQLDEGEFQIGPDEVAKAQELYALLYAPPVPTGDSDGVKNR